MSQRQKNRRRLCFFLFTIGLALFGTILFPILNPIKAYCGDQLNILLITIDTLRPDRLSCYGSEHVKTPNIDSLAARSVLFTRAFAHASTTLPSHTNILLGTTPLFHGVHDNGIFVVHDKFLTLSEHLRKAGYSTAAFVGAFPLDSRFGLNQGFDTYDDEYDLRHQRKIETGERAGQIVVDRAVEWLAHITSPWFLWVHCFDPHDPYTPPEPFRTQHKECLYDGEVAYVDFVMGKLFRYLDENDLSGRTLIIFTGDHGESLGEHGEITHGFLAYNSAIWIPLIISVQGVKPRIVHQNVSHIDLFPTVCDILKVETPSHLPGISLLPSMKGKKNPKRSIYFESNSPYYSLSWAPISGYIRQKEKFIESPIPELYDLSRDFDELENLAAGKSLEAFRKELSHIIHVQSAKSTVRSERRIDREALRKLESLGYIASYQEKKKEKFGPEDDVKVLLPYYNKSANALALYKRGRVKEAMNNLKDIITETKKIPQAYSHLATLYAELGRGNEAIEIMKMGREFLPENYKIFADYINYLYEAGRIDEVVAAFEEGDFIQVETDPMVWNVVGISYMKRGDTETAKKYLEKSISIDRKFAIPYNNLGTLYLSLMKRRDPNASKNAIEYFKKAVELDPYYSSAHHGLGLAYFQTSNFKEAILHLKKALEMQPDLYESLYVLGKAYFQKGDKASAYVYFTSFKSSPLYHQISAEEKFTLENYILQCKPQLKTK